MSSRRNESKRVAPQQGSEVDDVIKDLRNNAGFKAYIILNNDGAVIKWDQVGDSMTYTKAVHHAGLILNLCDKTRASLNDIYQPGDNRVESIRLRTNEDETIVVQYDGFTLIVIQEDQTSEPITAPQETQRGILP